MKFNKILLRAIRHIRVRPLCGLGILIIIAASIYTSSSIYTKNEERYSISGNNIFKSNGINAGDIISVKARVKSYCKKNIYGQTYMSVSLNKVLVLGDNIITGPFEEIEATFPDNTKIKIGQSIEFEGKLKYYSHATNPGEFDNLKYCYSRGILFSISDCRLIDRSEGYDRLRQTLYNLRIKWEDIYAKYLSIEDAAIMKAILCGNKNEIPSETKEMFQKNGIAHILAISGLHISFLAMTLYNLLKKIGLNLYACAGISEIVIISYGIMVGFSVSAFRAICMFSLFLLSKVILRTYDLLSALSLALILEIVLRPGMILDSGLQLSFLAVIGVGYFARNYSVNIWSYPKVLEAFFVSFWIFMVTLPILALTYYEVAFYSVILNLFIIPLMSILLVSGILLALFGFLRIAGLSLISARVSSFILYLYKATCKSLEDGGMGRINIAAPLWWQLLIYYILIIIAVNFSVKNIVQKKGSNKFKTISNIIFSFVLSILALVGLSFRPNTGLKIWALDVGQGDCMVIENDNGNFYIIDGGSSSIKNVGEKRIIPFLKFYGVNEVEAVFITHPDSDHMNGIAELLENSGKEHIYINNICIYEGFENNDAFGELFAMLEGDIGICGLKRGDRLVDENLIFSILYPDENMDTNDTNNASLVMHIQYGAFDVITTGDLEEAGEDWIVKHSSLNEYSDIEILKVAHHGSKSSSSEEFLTLLSPKIAFISVGKNNYSHPSPLVINRLDDMGIVYLRSDEKGCIICEAGKEGRYRISGF